MKIQWVPTCKLLGKSPSTQLVTTAHNLVAPVMSHAQCACSVSSAMTLGEPTDCSPPASSVHGILQGRMLGGGGGGLSCPPPGDLPDPGIKPTSLMFLALAGMFFTTSSTWEAPCAQYFKWKSSLSSESVHLENYPSQLIMSSPTGWPRLRVTDELPLATPLLSMANKLPSLINPGLQVHLDFISLCQPPHHLLGFSIMC